MSKAEVESLETLQVSLQQNPDSLTFARVADALMKNNRIDEALRICEEGIRRHPYYVTGHMVLGKCYMQKRYFDQAEKEFKRVLLFDPKYIAAHRYYGDLMREIGWENTCEMSYRKIQHLDPLDDKVQSIVEEFARKAETSLPSEPAPPQPQPIVTPRTAPAAKPAPAKEQRETPAFTVGKNLRSEPVIVNEPAAPSSNGDFEIPLVKRATPEAAPGNKNDEARFSSILDDIFQDEMMDEAPSNVAAFQRGKSDVVAAPPPAPRIVEPVQEESEDWKRIAKQEKRKAEVKTAPTIPVSDNINDRAPMPPPTPSKRRPVELDIDLDEFAASEERVWSPAARRREENLALKPEPIKTSDTEALGLGGMREVAGRDKIVTPTLGEIYAAQGQYAKAIGVFELLSKKDPANRNYRDKIDYLKKRLQETQNAG